MKYKMIPYHESDNPIMTYRESHDFEFLSRAVIADKPIRASNKKNFSYPSYLIAKTLEKNECLKSSFIEGDTYHRLQLEITDKGKQLHASLSDFYDGKLVGNDTIFEYWKTVNPSRLTQHFVNAAFAGQPDIVTSNHVFVDEYHIIRLAANDVMTALDTVFVTSEIDEQVNPHSPNEVNGGRLSVRCSGYDAHNRKIIEDETGITSDREFYQYILTVAVAVVLHKKTINKVFDTEKPVNLGGA